MKILEALGDAVQGLLSASTMWFVVAIASVSSVFLLSYVNNQLLGLGGCPLRSKPNPNEISDWLGVCTFIEDNKIQPWLGMIATIASVMLVVGAFVWLWQQLQEAQDTPSEFESLGQALETLLWAKTWWFIVTVAAIISVLMLFYGNGRLIWIVDCSVTPEEKISASTSAVKYVSDWLGICNLVVGDYRPWIGVTAVISIAMLVAGIIFWVLERLKPKVETSAAISGEPKSMTA